jgi:hypothetical protein
VIRSIAEITRAFTCNASRAITLRGTPGKIGLAAWIADALDRPPGEKVASREYRMPMSSDRFGEVVTRISYVSNAPTDKDFQGIASALRTLTTIRRTFTATARRAIVVRATSEELDLVDWLVQQLDKPAIGKPGALTGESSGTYRYDNRFDSWNTVKVLYLTQAATVEDFQASTERIRSASGDARMAAYDAPRAIALRGTVDQVETAERMAKGLDRSQ